MIVVFSWLLLATPTTFTRLLQLSTTRVSGCALSKTGIKKLRFPSDPRAKVRHQGPPVAAGEQPWGQILRREAISDYNTIGVIFTRL